MCLMSESTEQIKVVRRLREARYLFCHVPNGVEITERAKRTFIAEGVQKGVPDLMIFTPPPNKPEFVGCALEMKTTARGSGLRPNQKRWGADLQKVGWVWIVGWGAKDAIAKLRELGYDV